MTTKEKLLKTIDVIYANRNKQLRSDSELFNFLSKDELKRILDHLEENDFIEYGERLTSSAINLKAKYALEQLIEQEPEERIRVIGFGNIPS